MNLDDVVGTFQKWLYLPKPEALLAVLGTVAANRLPGDPVWLMVVGPPGGGKSEILQSLLKLSDTRPAATITERALLSGTAKKERDPNAKGGLLRELGAYGILICKDFGSLLSMHREERQRTMAALREVYDGSWTRYVGVDGGRVLHWTGKVGLIAGVTPTIDRHHGVMGAMGERFMLLRLPEAAPANQAARALEHSGRETEMRGELADAVATLFANTSENVPRRTEEERKRLIALATLVAKCRSSVERDSHSREIELVPGSEAPTRLIVALDRLLAGMKSIGCSPALAWKVVTETALDSMPRLRYDVLEILFMAAGAEVETGEIAEAVRHPTNTTRRTLEDLTAHYVIERHRHGQGNADGWSLAEWAHKRFVEAKSSVPEMSDSPLAGGVPEKSNTPRSAATAHASSSTSVQDDITGTVRSGSSNGHVDAAFVGAEPPPAFVGEEPPPP